MAEFGTGIAAAIGSWVALMYIFASVGVWFMFRKEIRVGYWVFTLISGAALLLGSPLALIPFGLGLALTGQVSNTTLVEAYSVLWAAMLIWEMSLLAIVYGIGSIMNRKRRRRPSNTPGMPDGVDVARLLATPDDVKHFEEITRSKILPM